MQPDSVVQERVKTKTQEPKLFRVILLMASSLPSRTDVGCRCVHLCEHGIEPVVVPAQRLAHHRQPLLDGFHAVRPQPAGAPGPVDPPGNQPGGLQDPQVPGDGGLRHVEGTGQLHHRGFPEGQARQNGASGWVRQREKGRIQTIHN